MPRWLGLTSRATSSTASGTTPSRQDRKIKLLFPDRPLGLTRVPQEPVQEPPEGLSCVGLLVSWWSFFSLGAAGPPSASERFKSGSLPLSRRPLPRPTLGRARTDSGWRLTLS